MSPDRTPFQALHLTRLASEFDVDVTPADVLSGADLDAWMRLVEDRLFESMFESKQTDESN
jgi:hypothetical protein